MDSYCSDDDDRMEDFMSVDEGYEDELDDDDIVIDDEGGEEEEEEEEAGRGQKTYKILKEADIKQLQENDISDVCNVLSVSRSVACTLLCQNKWTPSTIYDKWFERPLVVVRCQEQEGKMCKICFEPTEDILKTACGHPFCVDCWQKYIRTCIENGPGCLTLKCPEPGCNSHPGIETVELVSSPDDKRKYYRFLCRLYIESDPKKRKWCPAPGCDFAIEDESESLDVMCECGCKLCWRCGDECHSPLDCKTVSEWTEKNDSEAENTTWILAYTKPCPKCHRSIEKNHGCHHMTCSAPCTHEFCWTCLEDWNTHNKCNGYIGKEADKENREKAKQYMERYHFYYERWDSNDKSRKLALASLRTARNEQIGVLTKTHGQTEKQTNFVVEAWEQIVECRRVLKWSYAYGYYSHSRSTREKMLFFEDLQGQAEVSLERLHHCAEKEIDTYLKADGPCADDFNEFRKKLEGLTKVTKKYFENLVRALENDLCEVEIVGDVGVGVDDVGVDRKYEISDDDDDSSDYDE